jgi:threonine dehydratase
VTSRRSRGLNSATGATKQKQKQKQDLQPVFSFKIRGAYNSIANLTEEQKQAGIVACSAGNHAQGVRVTFTLITSRLL